MKRHPRSARLRASPRDLARHLLQDAGLRGRTGGAFPCTHPFSATKGTTCAEQHPLTEAEKKGNKMYVPSLHTVKPSTRYRPQYVQRCCILIDTSQADAYFARLWSEYEAAVLELGRHQKHVERDMQELFDLEDKATAEKAYGRLSAEELTTMHLELWDLHDVVDKQWRGMEQTRLFWAELEKERKSHQQQGAGDAGMSLSDVVHRMVASASAGIVKDLDVAKEQYRLAAAKVRFRFLRMNPAWFSSAEQMRIQTESGYELPSKWRTAVSAVGKGITRLATSIWRRLVALFSVLKSKWFWATAALGIILIYFVGLGTVSTFITSVIGKLWTVTFGKTTLTVWNSLKDIGRLACAVVLSRPILLLLLWTGWFEKFVLLLWKLPLIRAAFAAFGALFDGLIGLIPGIGTMWLAVRRWFDPVKKIESIVGQMATAAQTTFEESSKANHNYVLGTVVTYGFMFILASVLAPVLQTFGGAACTWTEFAGELGATGVTGIGILGSLGNLIGVGGTKVWSVVHSGLDKMKSAVDRATSWVQTVGETNDLADLWNKFAVDNVNLWSPIVDAFKQVAASLIDFIDTHTRQAFVGRILRVLLWVSDHIEWFDPGKYVSILKVAQDALKMSKSRIKFAKQALKGLTTDNVQETLAAYNKQFGTELNLASLQSWLPGTGSYASQDLANLQTALRDQLTSLEAAKAEQLALIKTYNVHPDWLDRLWVSLKNHMEAHPTIFWGGLASLLMFVLVSLMTNEVSSNRLRVGPLSTISFNSPHVGAVLVDDDKQALAWGYATAATPEEKKAYPSPPPELSADMRLLLEHDGDSADEAAVDWTYVRQKHRDRFQVASVPAADVLREVPFSTSLPKRTRKGTTYNPSST